MDTALADPPVQPHAPLGQRSPAAANWAVSAGLSALAVWAYLPTLGDLAHRWWTDPQYNHGFIVPVFAAGLLWTRRGLVPAAGAGPSWVGVPFLVAAGLMRLTGAYYFYVWLDHTSILLVAAGFCGLFAGRAGLRWGWPAVLFLAFMLPLPHRLETALGPALQRVAALASAYLLQTAGFCAVPDGNAILMTDAKVSVVRACSGLSMLVSFFALSVGLCLVVRRPLRDKAVILLSAAPVALIANVLRITATAVLHKTAGSATADAVTHDLAGWLMMPLAFALLWAELAYLGRLFVTAPPAAQ